MNYCVALLLCLTVRLGVSTTLIFLEDGIHAEEERLDKTTVNTFQDKVKKSETEQLPHTPASNELKDSSSSEESESSEEIKKLASSRTSSSSSESSEEESHRKKIQKRSLDSKPETVNSLGKNPSQAIGKTIEITDKNATSALELTNYTLEVKNSNDDIPKENSGGTESTTQHEAETTTDTESEGTADHTATQGETTTEVQAETTTEVQTESTTEVQAETTTEVQAEATTEVQAEITTEVQAEATTEVKAEATTEVKAEATTEVQAETTTEVQAEATTEVQVETTTEVQAEATTEVQTKSSSEESEEELPYYSPSSTPSSEVESTTSKDSPPKTMMEIAMDRVNKLSDQIRLVLATYKKVGVVVVPGQSFFPEPMLMQDFSQSFSIGRMNFLQMRVYGLSNFTVEHVNTDVDRMQVYILLHMPRLVILGNYTLRTFFSRAAGPFNVTLLDVDSEGVAEIETVPEGHLEATDSEMDMLTKDMRVDFKNLGFMGAMFQGMVTAVGDALFNSIKPQILERVNLVIRTDVNKKLKEFSTKFINKVNPVDLAFSEGRRYCKTHGYDPYHIGDHTFLIGGLVYVNITEFWVEGLSRFHRVGNLSLSMDAGVIEISVHVMTGKLSGQCHWTGQTFGITKYGKTNFTVDHLQVRAMVHQSLDVRKKPQLDDLDLELGWVKVTMDSPMTLSYMIEGIINAFPRLIRHIIVDTLEQPLKEKIQEILDKINVEAIVDENLPRLDTFGL